MSRLGLFSCLLLLSLGTVVLALAMGSASASPAQIFSALFADGDPVLRDLVLQLRLPRALTAYGTGAALAVAGVLLQVLLRNPLADPYILGTSGGAAAASLIAMSFGAAGLLLNGVALAGALGSTLLVFAIAQGHGSWAPGRLLLTGVVVAAGWGALISLTLALAPERNLKGMLFWLMGDFSFATSPYPILLIALLAVVAGVIFARSLNVLATGADQATLLGIAVKPMRAGLYIVSSLLTAVAVTTAGTVGFVGLVIPHLIRLIAGADHRQVIPCAALAGGSLLVVADTVARTIVAPRQLPVGAITAAIGVPLFLLLLRQAKTAHD